MIWKYVLEVKEVQMVLIPEAPFLLSLQMQGDAITVWALVDPEARTMPVTFKIVGTGHEAKVMGWAYLGTVQVKEYVWHIWYQA